jgi:hypothetical protein
MAHPNVPQSNRPFRNASQLPATRLINAITALFNDSRRCVTRRFGTWSNNQYFLARGVISDVSTASNSNFGSSASGAK